MWCRLVIFVLCSVTVYPANGTKGRHVQRTSTKPNSTEKSVSPVSTSSTTDSTPYEEFSTMEGPPSKIQPAEDSEKNSTLLKKMNEVCFPHLGCFSMEEPWWSITRPVFAPLSPTEINTRVYFYSRENPDELKEVHVYPTVDMDEVGFDPKKETAFITHGFASSGTVDWVKNLKNAYLKHVDANIFVVDWGKGASHLNYLQVAGNTRVVGRQIENLVKVLVQQYNADLNKFHLIGHSLGAHISAYVAKGNPGVRRLTACDPAQPGFELQPTEVRLDKNDADFIDVIHTNARPFIPTIGFGMMTPAGHVDFYMNGGYDQPGCLPPPKDKLPVITSISDLGKYPVEVLGAIISCPHGRSYEYLTEAFDRYGNCTFWGHKANPVRLIQGLINTATQGVFKIIVGLPTTCSMKKCVPLGFDAEKSSLRGMFSITTGARKPFCMSNDNKCKPVLEVEGT